MKHIVFSIKTYLLMGFCISLLLMSCTDNQNDLGVDIHPDNERLLVISDSSAEVKLYAVEASNLIHVNQSYGLLGHMFDPLIGDNHSSFIANSRPRVLSLDLGDSAIIDSMFLFVKYDTIYGTSNLEHKFNIYELYLDDSLLVVDLEGLDNDLASIASYYDPSSLIAEASYTPVYRSTDTTELDIIKVDLLQSENGRALAERIVLSPDSLYNHQPYVQEYIFNGLFFEAEKRTSDGAVIRVLANDSTRLTVYYRKLVLDTLGIEFEDTVAQALSFDFHSSYRANIYEHNFKPEVQRFDSLIEPEVTEIDSTVFLQTMNGIDGRIVISGFLDVLPQDTYIAINRAIISIQVEDSNYLEANKYPILPAFWVTVDDDNPTLDELWSGGTSSTYQPVPYYLGYYTFAITSRVVQYHKEGKDKIVLNLEPSNNHSVLQRVALKGLGNKTYPVKLRLTYTKINAK